MRALYRYGSELIWSVGPKCPLPFDKIIFPRNADLYPAYKHDNQTRGGFCLVCATGPFHWARGFSEKRVKCFWRIVGPARSLTLPLQKGDWTRWVSLPAEPTFGILTLMRPALGHKILVVIQRGGRIEEVFKIIKWLEDFHVWVERLREVRQGGCINGVVARQGSSVYKQKQEFDDRTTMFRLETNIYWKIIAECLRKLLSKTTELAYAREKTAAW